MDKEFHDKDLLESLQNKYQLFVDSSDGEIGVYLVLSKSDEVVNNLDTLASINKTNHIFKKNFSMMSTIMNVSTKQ